MIPVGTFFNTPKKTFILTIRKKAEQEKSISQQYKVFTYLCSTIGESLDTYRFDIESNDLSNAVTLYNLYKTNKSNKIVLDAVQADARAKLISIQKFGKESNWDINLFWTDEEKEAIGIKKKDNTMTLDEFNTFVGELIEDIKDYQEAIKCLK